MKLNLKEFTYRVNVMLGTRYTEKQLSKFYDDYFVGALDINDLMIIHMDGRIK